MFVPRQSLLPSRCGVTPPGCWLLSPCPAHSSLCSLPCGTLTQVLRRPCRGDKGTWGPQGRCPARLSAQTRGRRAVLPPCLSACLCMEGEGCSWYFYSNKKSATAFPLQLHGDMRREAGRSRQPRPAPRGCAGGTVTGGASPLLLPSQPRTLRLGWGGPRGGARIPTRVAQVLSASCSTQRPVTLPTSWPSPAALLNGMLSIGTQVFADFNLIATESGTEDTVKFTRSRDLFPLNASVLRKSLQRTQFAEN